MNISEEIAEWFIGDTIQLIDMVLDDSETDPQYSAVTAVNRIWLYLQYKNMTETTISTFLSDSGYPQEDISLLKKKYDLEIPIYHGDVHSIKF